MMRRPACSSHCGAPLITEVAGRVQFAHCLSSLPIGYPFHAAHYERDRPIAVGERLEVDTHLGKRVVEVLAISKSELVPYGSEDTRRNVTVDVRF